MSEWLANLELKTLEMNEDQNGSFSENEIRAPQIVLTRAHQIRRNFYNNAFMVRAQQPVIVLWEQLIPGELN